MEALAKKVDKLGYDLLELDKLIYFGINTGQTTTCSYLAWCIIPG